MCIGETQENNNNNKIMVALALHKKHDEKHSLLEINRKVYEVIGR